MGVTDKMWDAITTVIKMNDKVERLAGTVKAQQDKIENLTGRVIRLEMALEIALADKPSAAMKTKFHTVDFFRKIRDWQAVALSEKSPAEIIAFFSKTNASRLTKSNVRGI